MYDRIFCVEMYEKLLLETTSLSILEHLSFLVGGSTDHIVAQWFSKNFCVKKLVLFSVGLSTVQPRTLLWLRIVTVV
jgi:hypothetical protein